MEIIAVTATFQVFFSVYTLFDFSITFYSLYALFHLHPPPTAQQSPHLFMSMSFLLFSFAQSLYSPPHPRHPNTHTPELPACFTFMSLSLFCLLLLYFPTSQQTNLQVIFYYLTAEALISLLFSIFFPISLLSLGC